MSPDPKRWWKKLMRLSGLQARALQIPEILEAAEEHLRAVALPGLDGSYLPVRLSVAVASADLKGIAPFESDLRREVQDVVARLAARPRFKPLARFLELDLTEAEELPPGSAPRLHATFPEGTRLARWRPAPRSVLGPGTRVEAIRPPLFEVVLTSVSGEAATALQSVFFLCLESRLPVRCLDGGTSDDSLVVTAEGTLELLEAGEPWTDLEPKTSEVAEGLPQELDMSIDIPRDARSSVLYRFYTPGRPEVLWVPRGFLVIGRRSDLSHWVPGSAPQNLSGRHFAFVRAAGGGLRVVDLDSTNGTYLGGRRLRAFERVATGMPESIVVGTEGSMRLDLRLVD